MMVKDICSENNEDEFDSSYSEMKMEPGEYSIDVSPAEGKLGLIKKQRKKKKPKCNLFTV